jgi:hypothetical protein
VSHQAIDYNPNPQGTKPGGFTAQDIDQAKMRTTIGVVLTALGSVPLTWFGMKLWKEKKGVKEWKR